MSVISPIYPTTLFSWIIWSLAAAFYCYEYLLRILPSVMTEQLRCLFAINGLALGNLTAVYYYAYIPMQLPAGILMDRNSPRKILAIACLLCAFGTYLFGQSILWLAYLGRFLIGFGSSFAFIGVMKLSTLWFSENYFSLMTGLTTSLGMIGAMLGNMTLTQLILWAGMEKLLMFAVVFGIVLTFLIWAIIPEFDRLDKPNINHTLERAHYIKALITLCYDKRIWLLGGIGCFLFLSLTAFAEIWGIPYLTRHYQLSAVTAAHYNSLVFLGWAIGSPLMGIITNQLIKNENRFYFIAVNTWLGMICFSLMLYLPHIVKPYLGPLLFLFGLFSSVQIVVFTIVKSLYKENISGSAFALTNFLVMLGGGIAQPMIGHILDTFSKSTSQSDLIYFSASSFTYALSLIPIAFLCASILSIWLKKIVYDETHILK